MKLSLDEKQEISDHNNHIADKTSEILLRMYREYPDITPPILAALGCGLVFNAVKNHPDFRGADNDQVTREMHRLIDNFLSIFQPNMLN